MATATSMIMLTTMVMVMTVINDDNSHVGGNNHGHSGRG